jgi:hypothetical protein
MRRLSNPSRYAAPWLVFGLLAASGVVAAQQQSSNSTSGWKRVGDPSATYQDPATSQAPAPADNQQQGPYAPPPANNQQQPYQTGPYQQPNTANSQQPQNYPPPPPVPQNITIPAGTFLTVRVNQLLSSDHNHPGDSFSATLEQPVVVNGVVLAEPGQTLGGRVAEAEKAGRIEGVSRLAIQLTELTLVDGQQLPLQAQLVSRRGPTSTGQDAGMIAGTTGLGAAIGAAAGWGRGAAIGAGAGAAAGILGVLLTRGHPSVIYPEQLLTFRIDRPLTVFTGNSQQAFRYVQPGEYDRPASQPTSTATMGPPPAPAPPVWAPYPYPYGYPYYWGPTFSFYYGPRFWHGGGYWHGGYWGGRGWHR